jgi:hypothetical protein
MERIHGGWFWLLGKGEGSVAVQGRPIMKRAGSGLHQMVGKNSTTLELPKMQNTHNNSNTGSATVGGERFRVCVGAI